MSSEARPNGIPGLVAEAFHHLRQLIRGEFALAQAEVAAKARKAGFALAVLAFAAVLTIVALNLLAFSLVSLIVLWGGLPPGAAALLLGLILLAGAVFLALRARAALTPSALAPSRTAHRIREDADHITKVFRHD
ncbi:phage holin family protein (plasmid) [Gemmobacter fulvus]|uniref:Phage holin family protein n=1 Tax=Gemmobacter fulvus TaxID=2840474 RepID=A0A975PBE6_9RHOB|nr:phage holin family protein [Gemmobacter fulvus]MBT9246532.1 phage holin family protein [Gemmobacter fulvus]MDQ1849660.1 phage holin family protein [Gemmobacter fulvus]QWK92628.1 phage holin family protein [Gemmobacter fulvus]